MDSSFGFVSAHLSAGQHQVDDRIKNYKVIKKQFNKSLNIKQTDYLFWLGDLNFRISLPREEVEQHIKDKHWDHLFEFDQLQHARKEKKVFKGFKEGHINFAPTYKYDPNTSQYDTSEKKRVPAWTDRILWRTYFDDVQGWHIDLESYNRSEILLSDHRPISALFSVDIKKTDKEKLEKLEKELNEKQEGNMSAMLTNAKPILSTAISSNTHISTSGNPSSSTSPVNAKLKNSTK